MEPTKDRGEMMKPKVVKVNILGQNYVVRSAAGQKYLERVAKYVNEKMEEIKSSGIDDSQQLRIAILAAMNISDELFSNQRTTEKMKNEVEGKISSLIEIVDEVIQQ